MRICVVGNSHMGCLKQAWDSLAPHHPGIKAGFFGLPAGGLRALAARPDGRLGVDDPDAQQMLSRIAGGAPDLDPAAWDGFVLTGLAVNLRPQRVEYWPDRRLSAAVRTALVRARFAPTAMAHVLRLLRASRPCPVWLVPQPLSRRRPGETIPELPPHAQSAEQALADLRLALEDETTRVVGQPTGSIIDGLWTDARYGEGAVGIASAQEKGSEDFGHMNAAYGRLIWETLLAMPVPAAGAAAVSG